MSSMMRGISLILIVALLSQTAGCYTTRIQHTRGEEIKEDELLKGMLVYMTLRQESELLKRGEIGRGFECVIKRMDQKNNTIVVVAFNKIYDIKPSDIQKIEIIDLGPKEKVFEQRKSAFLTTLFGYHSLETAIVGYNLLLVLK